MIFLSSSERNVIVFCIITFRETLNWWFCNQSHLTQTISAAIQQHKMLIFDFCVFITFLYYMYFGKVINFQVERQISRMTFLLPNVKCVKLDLNSM